MSPRAPYRGLYQNACGDFTRILFFCDSQSVLLFSVLSVGVATFRLAGGKVVRLFFDLNSDMFILSELKLAGLSGPNVFRD